MSYLDDEDEGDVPPLLDVSKVSLNEATAQPPAKAAAAQPPAKPPMANAAAPAAPAPKSKPPEERGGLKKGFLGGGSSSAGGSKAAAKASASADMPEVKANKQQKEKSLQLPEVQQQIAEEGAARAAAGGGAAQDKSWVTPDLIQKIGASPVLRKAFTDPRCQEAMTMLQSDPQAAMKKYGDSAEMREFLQAFMKMMGEHFTALADKQDTEAGKKGGKKGGAGGGAGAGAAGVVTREAPAAPPIAPAKTAEERKAEAAVESAMKDPEVVAILQEPAVQALLGKLQMGQSHELGAALRSDPAMVAKLRKLSQAGLIGMHWAA